MNVQIHDFQSIDKATLRLQGLTVIVGPSNRGKSALLRAIEGALFNRPGDQFARVYPDGTVAPNAVVALDDVPGADGAAHAVRWTKGKANRFSVDGVDYARVGAEAPAPLQEVGYRDVFVGDEGRKSGERIRPQVGTQFEPLFLLTRPGSFLADVLGLLSRQAVVATAQGRCASDLRSTKQRAGVRAGDLVVARERIALFTLPPAAVSAEPALVKVAQLARVRQFVADRHRLLDAIRQPVPLSVATFAHGVLAQSDRIVQARALVARRAALGAVCEGVLPPDVATGLYDGLYASAKLVAGLTALARLRPVLQALPAPPVVPDLSKAVAQLAVAHDLVARRTALLDTVRQSEGTLHELETEEEVAETAKAELFASLEVCPTCDRPMVGFDHGMDEESPAPPKGRSRKKA